MDIKILISQMIMLFLIMALGYLIFKAKLVDEKFTKTFSQLILKVTMPATVLSSVCFLRRYSELRRTQQDYMSL